MSPVAPASFNTLDGWSDTSCISSTAEDAQRILSPQTTPSAYHWPITARDLDYLTISITSPYTTYTTTILLGNSFPTTAPIPLAAVPQATATTTQVQQFPGLPTSIIVGIVVGCALGCLLLLGVLYVYMLRARQRRRQRRRRRRRSKSRSSSGRSSRGVSSGLEVVEPC